jgi:two-component system osmolarity sensor histidine kinase EnvZ
MMQPFTRMEEARTGASGSGLGLAIVDRVVRAHGGRFELLPNAGGGLIARITIPSSPG